MKYKKNRAKSIQNGMELINGDLEEHTDEQNIVAKKKKIEKEKQGTKKKTKKTNGKVEKDKMKKEPPIKRSDSPGIDLSIFQPRGKRKCVIQNELKKQRTEDWWSDDDEEMREEMKTEKPLEEEDDEIEEEIPDNDEDDVDDEQEVEIKDEDVMNDDEDDEEEEEIEDLDEIEDVKQPIKGKANGKKKSPKQPVPEKNELVQKTVRCFVFSTAMANRAGHAVSKSLFDSISKYHEAQKWETPYLTSEIHCRPFIAALEDELEKREQKESLDSKLETPVNGIIEAAERVVSSKEEKKERALSMDTWQKEQVIQAAQRMGRNGTTNKENTDDVKANPLHPRFHLPGGTHNNHRLYSDPKTEPNAQTQQSTDSESSPQTVPKIEKVEKEPLRNYSPSSVKASVPPTSSVTHHLNSLVHDDYKTRYNSPPPQLVPNPSNRFKHEHVLTEKREHPKVFAPDVLKEQVQYHSPKDFNIHKLISKPTPISSLNESTRSALEVKNVSSSIESAEKARIEARMKMSPPILPRDVHPSAFISPRERDGHVRPPHFNGYSNGNAIFNSHLRPHSFSPPTSRHYQHSREAIENIVDFSRNSVIIPPPPVRPSASRANGFPESKTFEDYKPLSSISTSIHQRKDRPSSLPITDIYTLGKEKKPHTIHSSFSVDSLTKSHTRNERTADENSVARHIERRFPISSHTHPFHERLPILPAHELHSHERLHVPNGLNIHGLKRSLDEQLSSNIHRVEAAERDRERKYPEHLTDWFWKDKERRIAEFERLLPTRPPFHTDHRSPLHVPPIYLPPRGVPLNGHRGELPSPPVRRMYSPYARR